MKHHANKKDYLIECVASIFIGGICFILILGLISVFFWIDTFLQVKSFSTAQNIIFAVYCTVALIIFIPFARKISENRLIRELEITDSNINLSTPFSAISVDRRTVRYILLKIDKKLNLITIKTDIQEFVFFANKNHVEEIINGLRSICKRAIYVDHNNVEHFPDKYEHSDDLNYIYKNYKRILKKNILKFFLIFSVTGIMGAGGIYSLYLWLTGNPKGKINHILLSMIVVSIGSFMVFLNNFYKYRKIRNLTHFDFEKVVINKDSEL